MTTRAPREFVFAGSSYGEPWWVIGDVTRRLLEPHGFDVSVATESAATENPRWVGSRKALVGACVPSNLAWAQQGEHQYEGETFPPFRAIALILRPFWLGVAATAASQITSLHQIRERELPVRVLMDQWDSIASVAARRVLSYHGLDRERIERWGGRVHGMTGTYAPFVREGDVDLILGNLYLGQTAISRYWVEASVLCDLRFFDLDRELVDLFCRGGIEQPGLLPAGLVRGLDRDVQTVRRGEGIIVYACEDLPEDLAYLLAKVYDEQRSAFLHTRVHMALDPGRAPDTAPLPLHAGAERYYREKGTHPGASW